MGKEFVEGYLKDGDLALLSHFKKMRDQLIREVQNEPSKNQ